VLALAKIRIFSSIDQSRLARFAGTLEDYSPPATTARAFVGGAPFPPPAAAH
jgi:hypothetical protein